MRKSGRTFLYSLLLLGFIFLISGDKAANLFELKRHEVAERKAQWAKIEEYQAMLEVERIKHEKFQEEIQRKIDEISIELDREWEKLEELEKELEFEKLVESEEEFKKLKEEDMEQYIKHMGKAMEILGEKLKLTQQKDEEMAAYMEKEKKLIDLLLDLEPRIKMLSKASLRIEISLIA